MTLPDPADRLSVPTAWTRDGRLRFRDLGVLIAVADAGGTATVRSLAGQSTDGSDAVLTALRRLADLDYVYQHTGRRGWRLRPAAADQWRTANGGAS